MTISNYILHFDATFGTNISEVIANKKFPMLEFALEELGEELYALNADNRQIGKDKLDVYQKLEQTMNDEQKKLIDQYFDLEDDYYVDTEKQILVFGFCLAYEQLREMNALKD